MQLARELDAHSEVSVRLAVLGDGPLAEDGLLGSLASRPNVVCYTGGNAFAQITRALCTATSPAEPSAVSANDVCSD